MYPKIESRTSNQFYILDIDLKETLEKDCLVGTFEAHSWNIENNWHPSSSENLPYKGGFGTDIKPRDIITKLKELLVEDPYLDESSLQPIYEMLTHYTPTEFKELLQKLTKLNFEYDISDNKLIQVALKK